MHSIAIASGDEYRNIFKKCNRLQFFLKKFPAANFSMDEELEISIYSIAKHRNNSSSTVIRGLINNPSTRKATRLKIAKAGRLQGYRSNLFASSLRRQKRKTTSGAFTRINRHYNL